MTLQVVLERGVVAALRSMPPVTKRRVRAALRGLGENPLPRGPGGPIKRLDRRDPSAEPLFRLRMGEYRAVFVVRPPEVRVLHVFHRSEGYGWMRRLGLD